MGCAVTIIVLVIAAGAAYAWYKNRKKADAGAED